jgi:hypothetical protein
VRIYQIGRHGDIPVFGKFLYRLAKDKPGVATRFLARADDNVLNFLPAFLNGLNEAGRMKNIERS